MKIWTLAFGLMMGCNTDGVGVIVDNDPDDINGNDDADGPLITHIPIEESQPIGEDVFISATAVDAESGVIFVSVFYKQETNTNWEDAALRAVDAAGTYEGYIPGDDVKSAGMDYYIAATDAADNTSTLPDNGEEDAYHFRVSAN